MTTPPRCVPHAPHSLPASTQAGYGNGATNDGVPENSFDEEAAPKRAASGGDLRATSLADELLDASDASAKASSTEVQANTDMLQVEKGTYTWVRYAKRRKKVLKVTTLVGAYLSVHDLGTHTPPPLIHP